MSRTNSVPLIEISWHSSSPHPDGMRISASEDYGALETPKVLIGAQGKERLLFLTIIGDSDVQAGQKAWLCYANFDDNAKSEQQFVAREIVFGKAE